MKRKHTLAKILGFLSCGLMLVSCAVNGTISLKFKVLPQETYDACEDENEIKERIIVNVSGKDYNLNELESIGAYVSGLDFSNSGKHTLTISYLGNTISYEYEVIGDKVISGFNKSSEGVDLNDHSSNTVFGFNSVTGELGLYNKDTYVLEGTSEVISNEVYLVASQESDFDKNATNAYLVVDEIKLTDTLVFENPVNIIATTSSNAINGDVEIYSEDDVNFKIDADIYGTLTIDCPNGHIEHYGQANKVEVLAASSSTYEEHGVNAELVVSANAENVVINEDAIVYYLDMTNASKDTTITNNGTIYRYSGDHTITNNGFIYQDAIEKDGQYNLPMCNGIVNISNYMVKNVTMDISNSNELVWFSNLSQSGKSPLIQDQPLVNVNITNDIDMKGIEWKPIANWNIWANGTACRWFGGDYSKYSNGWEAYCDGDYSANESYKGSQFDFVSTDEMYCRAFYNESYTYNGAKISPIYYIRLVLNGNNHIISNLTNTFVGCLGYDSNIHDLKVNYNESRYTGYKSINGSTDNKIVWNNLNGINVKGCLEGGCNCHFGLFCTNIYVPEIDGKVAGTVTFDSITLGGTFKYRHNYTGSEDTNDSFFNGQYVIGAFASLVCAKGNNVNENGERINCLIFNDITLGDTKGLDFLITKRVNGVEYVSQWGSSCYAYDEKVHSNSCNYALFADYCCGTNGHDKSTFTTFDYDEDAFKTVKAQTFKTISNNQAGYYEFSDKHNCANDNDDEYVVVWEGDCEKGDIVCKSCSTCGKQIINNYIRLETGHNYTSDDLITENGVSYYYCDRCEKYFDVNGNEVTVTREYTLVTDVKDLKDGSRIVIAATDGTNYYASSTPKESSNKTLAITVDSAKITSTIDDTYVYTLGVNDSGNFKIIDKYDNSIKKDDTNNTASLTTAGSETTDGKIYWSFFENDDKFSICYTTTQSTYIYFITFDNTSLFKTRTAKTNKKDTTEGFNKEGYYNLSLFIESTILTPVE